MKWFEQPILPPSRPILQAKRIQPKIDFITYSLYSVKHQQNCGKMDFFNQQNTVLVHAVQMPQQEEDDAAAPFVDENPCLVCGHKAFANFINLSYETSCTSTTVMPVKKRLKDVIGKVWNSRHENQTLCLACYDLVDRFDSLESQLNTIRENIKEKYLRTAVKISGKQTSKGNSKKKKFRTGPKRYAKRQKYESQSEDEDDPVTFTVEICPDGNSSDYTPPGGNGTIESDDTKPTSQFNMTADSQNDDQSNANVYDEHHQLLQRGEKIRLGKANQDDNGVETFVCAYCPQVWADISSLHSHVHSIHQPEVVDVAIPVELGLGNTMNCGVEIQNCQEPTDNPKPWSCLFCDSSFRARTNMSSHFKEKHTPYKPFSCSDCSEAFRKGIDLNRHKLYFCSRRTVSFAPKRKYRKRDSKEKNSPKIKVKLEEEKQDANNTNEELSVS